MLDQAIYRISDPAVVGALVAEHSWVTLVSDLPDGLVVSHLPVIVDDASDDEVAVVGHLARVDADEHELGRHPVVLVVQGPQGYVTAAWYSDGPAVPTWNFVVAHLYGTPVVLDADATYDVLDRTVDQYETARPDPFRLGDVADYAHRLAPHTTGFRLVASRVVAKAKLSQDKSAADRAGVVDGLESDPVHANRALADRMRADGVLP